MTSNPAITMPTQIDRHGPKGNNPPTDAELLQQKLSDENKARLKRRDDLLDAVERVGDVTDANAEKVTSFIKQLDAAAKDSDNERKKVKEPWFLATKIIDGFFNNITDPLESAHKAVNKKLSTFMNAKAEAERKAREENAAKAAEEARIAAENADKLAAQSKPKGGQSAVDSAEDAAIAAALNAANAEAVALHAPLETAKISGTYGASAALKTDWVFEIEKLSDIPLDELRPYLPLPAIEQALRAYVKAGNRTLKGVRIFQQATARVR